MSDITFDNYDAVDEEDYIDYDELDAQANETINDTTDESDEAYTDDTRYEIDEEQNTDRDDTAHELDEQAHYDADELSYDDEQQDTYQEDARDLDNGADESDDVPLQQKVMAILGLVWANIVANTQKGYAIARERFEAIDWVALREGAVGRIQSINGLLQNRVPEKFHKAMYAGLIGILLLIPLGIGASFMLGGSDAKPEPTSDIVMVGQQSDTPVTANGIIAPFFTPTVQYWSDNLDSWTSNSAVTPDMLAIVMQLQSCGNPNYETGGLFGVPSVDLANQPFNDIEANAQLAVARLEAGLKATDDDFGLALAYYVDGDTALSSDFTQWSQSARDLFIIGRNLYNQAQNDMNNSVDINAWVGQAGAGVCSQAQIALNR